MISAKIILDSCSADNPNHRITTVECVFPKFLQAQLNTHRKLSKNSASSRAIPFSRMVQNIKENPVKPIRWGKNQPGMSADEELAPNEKVEAEQIWQQAMDSAIDFASKLNELKVHKQTINRLIEPFFYTKVLVTSTEWDNFFKLRCEHSGAQDEMQDLAIKIRECIKNSEPQKIEYEPSPIYGNSWHIPYIKDDEKHLKTEQKIALSVARCARVSYLNFNNTTNIEDDIKLFEKLKTSGHWSPFEHIARLMGGPEGKSRNFDGWLQLRELVDNV